MRVRRKCCLDILGMTPPKEGSSYGMKTTPLSLGNIILLKEKGERESQFLGRLIGSPGSLRRRAGSGSLKEETGIWNSQGGKKDKHLLLLLLLLFPLSLSTFLSLSHIKLYSLSLELMIITKQLSLNWVLRII